MCPRCPFVCCWLGMLACVPLFSLLCFLSPYPTHASGFNLSVQQVSDRLGARHVVLVMCPRCPFVCCWLAGYIGMCPLTSLLCFLSPYPTHASGSLLLLQLVSDRLAARYVVCLLCALVALLCAAGWVCWHVSLCLACFVFSRPTPHMHLDST